MKTMERHVAEALLMLEHTYPLPATATYMAKSSGNGKFYYGSSVPAEDDMEFRLENTYKII